MKIEMLEDYGVKADCTPWLSKGAIVDLEPKEAVMLLETRRAIIAGSTLDAFSSPATETATVKPKERRTRKKATE